MGTVYDISWKPALGSPWVTYHVFLREKGTTTWGECAAVKHPRIVASGIPAAATAVPGTWLIFGRTYECTILSTTRLNVWNDWEGASIVEFTAVDASPTPGPPASAWVVADAVYGRVINVRATPGDQWTYWFDVYVSNVNDSTTATKQGRFYQGVSTGGGYLLVNFLETEVNQTRYFWVKPVSYWEKEGEMYPSRFAGMSAVVPYPSSGTGDSHSR